jgi:hypothetical protein
VEVDCEPLFSFLGITFRTVGSSGCANVASRPRSLLGEPFQQTGTSFGGSGGSSTLMPARGGLDDSLDRLARTPGIDPAVFDRASHDAAWRCAYSWIWRAHQEVIRDAPAPPIGQPPGHSVVHLKLEAEQVATKLGVVGIDDLRVRARVGAVHEVVLDRQLHLWLDLPLHADVEVVDEGVR